LPVQAQEHRWRARQGRQPVGQERHLGGT
jgi:hypothetical protein